MCRDKQLEISGTKYSSEKTTAWARNPHRWVSAPIFLGGRGTEQADEGQDTCACVCVVGAGRGLGYTGGWTRSEIEAQAKHSRVKDLSLNPDSHAYLLCDLGHIA